MADDAILEAHGFTREQAVDAIARDPNKRTVRERDLIAALVKGWMEGKA